MLANAEIMGMIRDLERDLAIQRAERLAKHRALLPEERPFTDAVNAVRRFTHRMLHPAAPVAIPAVAPPGAAEADAAAAAAVGGRRRQVAWRYCRTRLRRAARNRDTARV